MLVPAITFDAEDAEDFLQALDMLAAAVAGLGFSDCVEAACFVQAMTQRIRAKHSLPDGPLSW